MNLKPTATRIILAAALAFIVVEIIDLYNEIRTNSERTAIQAEPGENWVRIESATVHDGGPDLKPMFEVKFQILRPVRIRVRSDVRNVDTGQVLCSGQMIIGYVLEPPYSAETSLRLATLAGLNECIWPPGNYQADLTWVLTDDRTSLPVAPIVGQYTFTIHGAETPFSTSPAPGQPTTEAPAAVEPSARPSSKPARPTLK